MTKESQERQKTGSDSLAGELNRASNKEGEVDYSEVYSPSFGYGNLGYGNQGYGPSLAQTGRSLQPTGQRRSANFSRITAEPIDGLAASAKDGKPSVKEDSLNEDLANNKHASKGDDTSLGGNFPENLISTTLLQGEHYIIEVPAGLKVDDPLFIFEIQVKLLVKEFGFEANDARELIQYLSQQGSTGINVYGYTAQRPDGRRFATVNLSKDTANSYRNYRNEAVSTRQRNLEAQRDQQQKLSKEYLSAFENYGPENRDRLNQLFLSLTEKDRKDIDRETDEIYKQIAGSNSNPQLREAIRIAVMNKLYPARVQDITSGKASARARYISYLRRHSPKMISDLIGLVNELRNDYRKSFDERVQELYGQVAANSSDRELLTAIQIWVLYERFPINVQNILNPKAPAQNTGDRRAIPPQNQNTSPRSSSSNNQRIANQQRQPGAENNNDRTRWQVTAQAFNQRFGANYSREQIIAIQQLVGATPDGSYGEETARKVYLWQQNNKIPNPDGLVGEATWGAMVARLPRTRTDVAPAESSNANNPPAPTSQVAGTRTQNNTVPVTDSSSNDVALLESSNASNAPAVTSQVTGTRTQSNTVPVTDSSSNAEKASLTERATPSNLNEEIDLYQTALFQEIPQISARLQAGLNSKVFNQETVAAWHRLSELMIRLYPAAKASNVDPKLSQAIVDAGSQLFEGLLQQVSNTSTPDGRVGMRRLLPPALAGAGKKIAELVAQNNWNGLYQQYFEFAITFDNWLQEGSNYRAGNETQLKADRAGTERVEYLRGMGQQLQKFKTESTDTNPVRLIADFYPQEKASEGSANQLEKIPLSLYLGQKESQFLGQTNNQWILTQITPKNAIDVSVPKKPEETNPPQELFDNLNSPNRFPKGIIRYTLPNGAAGMVEVDGGWKLSDWLALIGLGAGLAALTIFTLGSGTVLVSTIGYPLLYLGAGAQIGSSVANIGERSRDGTINPMQVSLDAVNIASALTGIGATTAGMIVVDASRSAQTLAPYKGMMAKLATFADGWFLPLTGANLAADGATVVLMSADAYKQSQDIWEGPGEEGDKRKAMALLIAQLAVTGGLLTLSLRGNIADLRDGQRLVLGIDENGVPVARSREQTGETSPAARTTEQTQTTLSEAELRAYMAAPEVDNDWKALQKEILQKANNPELMLQFTRYRQEVFERYEAEIKNQFNDRVEGVFIEKGEGGAFKSVIAGSVQPTSDYDATFVSPTGDKRVELEAVIAFNRRFRQEFGKESGTVFDTNVYTTGHTLPSSMGDRLSEVMAMRKLEELFNLPDDLRIAKDELNTLEGRARKEKADKIKKMEDLLPEREQKIREIIDEINKLRRAHPNNSEPELPVDNIDDLSARGIGEQKELVTTRLIEEVSQERHQNRTSEAAQAQLAADRDVMALLKQRRYMTDEEWHGGTNQAGERVEGYRDRMLASTDESVRAATAARLDKADEIYKRATQELHEKIVELNRNKPSGERVLDTNGSPETDVAKIVQANGDAQLEAFNRLYEHYLIQAQDIRDELERYRKMRSGEIERTLTPAELESQIDRLTIELNEMQSKALFFANEAYHTGPAVEHVVLGQQLELELPLEIDEYLISINEQVGFAMEQVTADKDLGKALWKSAKYMDRVNDAITNIQDKERNLFDSVAKAKNAKMKSLFDELILIKKEKGKYYQISSEEAKSEAAIKVAKSRGFDFGSAENLRQELLKFNIEVNTQIRNARNGQYNRNPSSLDSWPVASPNQNSRQSFTSKSEKIAHSPAKNLELAEFG